MPTLLLSNWRYFAIAGAIIAVFFGGDALPRASWIAAVPMPLFNPKKRPTPRPKPNSTRRPNSPNSNSAAERTKSADLTDHGKRNDMPRINARLHFVCCHFASCSPMPAIASPTPATLSHALRPVTCVLLG